MAEDKIQVEIVFETDEGSVRKVFTDVKNQAQKGGDTAGKSFSSSFAKAALAGGALLAAATTVAAAARALGSTFRDSISLAAQQETAVNNLNTSLKLAGTFSNDASKDFQNLASSIQSLSTFGDEAILQQAALARNFTSTNEEAKALTQAAVDLSAATGLTLESSIRNLGKTFGGLTGELGETLPQLKNLSPEALKAGGALEFVAQRFGGAAQAQLNTFNGAVGQLTNIFGDFREALGSIITSSPTVIAAIRKLSGFFVQAAKPIREFAATDPLNRLIQGLINVGQATIKFVIKPLEVLRNVGVTVFNALVVAGNGVVAGFGKIAEAAAKLIGFVSGENSITAALKTFGESSQEVLQDSIVPLQDSIKGILDPGEFTAKSEEFLVNLQSFADNAKAISSDLESNFDGTNKTITKKASTTSKQLANLINQALVQTTSRGIQSLTQSLISGTNAFANFGKQIFSILGDLSIKLGETLIFTGKGIESLKTLSGGPAIAAGAGLIALGTILKSLGEGPGIAGSPAGAGAAGFSGGLAGSDPNLIQQQEDEEREQEFRNQIVVQGDLFETEETGRRLVELINDANEQDGTVLTNVSFA